MQKMTVLDVGKALAVGILTAVVLSLVMVPLSKMGLSPLPKPLSLAFAQKTFGDVSLPFGLALHVLYVTFWSVVYVVLFRPNFKFRYALALALALWVVVLLAVFPYVGWGLFGLEEGLLLIPGSLMPHILFAVVLWGMCKWLFKREGSVHQRS